MGRAYTTEILELDATFEWAFRASVSELAESIGRSARHPLISVGSGGSLTTAHFASLLHSRFTGQPTQCLTPYELVTTPQSLTNSTVLLCSAGGSNPDVLITAQQVMKRFPFQLLTITTRLGTPLQTCMESAGWPRCHPFETPTRKDGFLATNSLLASLILLTRAYETWAGVPSCLPETLDQLLHPRITRRDFVENFNSQFGTIAENSTIIVLYGAGTKPAAVDIESRFTEAAFAAVQISDFRNFAHGRHHWLARHGATSGVLAIGEEEDEIARRTLSLLPISTPNWLVSVEGGTRGTIAAIVQSMMLAQVVGRAKNIDPGRPQVPTFGRKLYHLKAMPSLYPKANEKLERMNLAIERKSGCPVISLKLRDQFDIWEKHYLQFVDRLSKARIRSVVMDFDGTLCAPERRFDGLTSSIAERINVILTAGFTVAIATGRGRSVREALLPYITCKENQSRLIIGYHNGAEIAPISDHLLPPHQQPLAQELVAILSDIHANQVIARYANIFANGKQISLECIPSADFAAVTKEVNSLFKQFQTCGAKVVVSSHSIDIIAPGISKMNVVEYVSRRLDVSDCGLDTILCIGDRGRAPGNDAELLTHPLSLSVDEVNDDPFTCWSIAKPGLRFDLACLEYLTRLKPEKAAMRFDISGVKP